MVETGWEYLPWPGVTEFLRDNADWGKEYKGYFTAEGDSLEVRSIGQDTQTLSPLLVPGPNHPQHTQTIKMMGRQNPPPPSLTKR